MKHFTPEELYEIAVDEYRRDGRHVGQAEREGLSQWAYWSAERNDFRTKEEARARSSALAAEEKGMMD